MLFHNLRSMQTFYSLWFDRFSYLYLLLLDIIELLFLKRAILRAISYPNIVIDFHFPATLCSKGQ